MIIAYRYGSLAITLIGIGWAIVFGAIGWWGVVALDFVIIASGLSMYLLIRKGRLDSGLLAGQIGLVLVVIAMGLMLDVPTAEAPRVTHLYLLVLAALGYLNYQRSRSRAQLVVIGVCLVVFVIFASARLETPLLMTMPEAVRISGTWANTIMATTLFAGCIYALQAEFIRKDKISRDLMAALWNDEFHLVYQPQVNLAQTVIGAEALLRWNSPQRGAVAPADFIPQAEEAGLMVSIGGWVLREGCRTLAEWGRAPQFRHLALSVNVSTSQLLHEDFEASVREALEASGADPRRLVLELTESVLVTETELVAARLRRLRDLGITIALDDFGTGYSSLSYLRHLPIQQIKIDRGFVQDVVSSTRSASLVRTVIALGRDLGQDVLAEGVETAEQHALLAQAGCTLFQGYLYGRPMPLAEFAQRVELDAASRVPVPLRANG